MKHFILFFLGIICCLALHADNKNKIPPQDYWNESENRDLSSPQLYQDDSSVYVYSEKQLDNLYIGITDMNWNVVYDETTTVPAGTYYAVSIASLPAGTYYITIMQGNEYIIGIFQK